MKQELINSVNSANKESDLVYQTALTTKRNIVVTGVAGTGKTSIMKKILNDSSKKSLMLNGDNSQYNANVYSYFDILWWCYFHDDGVVDRMVKSYKKEKTNEIKQLDLLIIDDIFGIALPTIATIEKILRKIRGNWMPFGGVQMIYCGDWNNAGMNDAYRHKDWEKEFFFDSFAFRKSEHVYIELKKNYVFTDEKYLQVLRSVRRGENAYLPLINKICLHDKSEITEGTRISYYQNLSRDYRSIGLSGQLLIDDDCFRKNGQLYQVLRKAKSLSQLTMTHDVNDDDVVLNNALKIFLKRFPN